MMNNHSTIGEDLVAMCVNDLITCGAEPIFFLDYLVTEKINLSKSKEVLKGIAKGCQISNCSLIGGETAEHPNAFPKNKYDLAGFCVGIVEKENIKKSIPPKNNDVLISLKSSGLHSNGFSLVRELIKRKKINLKNKIGNKTIGEVILKPTKIYVKEILELKKKINIKAIAHITGGGLTGNLERIIPKNMKITLFKNTLFNFHKKLFLMLKKASNLGLVRSQYALGRMYDYGFGIARDQVEAAKYVSLAAQKGFDKAQYNLGKRYRDGKGVSRSLGLSAKWFLAAAEQGHVRAQNHIGVRLIRGDGIEKNPAKGLMYLILAAEKGHIKAAEHKAELSADISIEDKKMAEEMATRWKPTR